MADWLTFQIWRPSGDLLRADQLLSTCLGINRSQFKRRVEQLYRNGRPCRLAHSLADGDQIALKILPVPASELVAEQLPLDVLYQDDDLFVINKAAGVVVHPGCGHHNSTLIQGVLYLDGRLKEIDSDPLRLGLVHRLDKDTSGVLLIARNSASLNFFSQQFATRQVKKYYLALVRGNLANQGFIDAELKRDPKNRKRFTVAAGGKKSQTSYRVLSRNNNYALVKLNPLTGRTHQLRCHLQHLNAPIVGDKIYGRNDAASGTAALMLHALALEITLTNGRKKMFFAPLPPHFKSTCRQLLGSK